MRKLFRSFGLIFLLGILSLVPINAQSEFDYLSLYFDSMNTSVFIESDGVYTVETEVVAQFNNPGRGIEVWIPQDYDMTFQVDGETVDRFYYWPVENINVEDHPFTTYSEGDFKVIRIGDPDVYISGEQTYRYTYQIQTGSLRIEDFQRIMWDVQGSDWRVPIVDYRFSMTLPEPVSSQPEIYSGYWGSEDNTLIDYEFDGQTLIGQSTEPLQPGQSVTVYLDVPNDYFDYPTPTDYLPFVLGFSVALGLLSVFLFYRHGKDYPMVQTIEIEAPDGYSSAMVGYAFDGAADNRDVLSLIVQWASKGLLSIKEVGKDNMELTKLKDISADVPSFEATFFNRLFESGDVVRTVDLEEKFYVHVEKAKNGLTHYFKKKQYRLFYPASSFFKVLLTVLAPLILTGFVTATIYNQTGYQPFILPSVIVTFVISLVHSIFFVVAFSNFTIRKNWVKTVLVFAGIAVSVVLVAIMMGVLGMFMTLDFTILLVLLLYFMVLVIAVNMTKRTQYGTIIQGKILGLRTFIQEAELDELEMLVNDDPQFFYRILPYAYVLNLSDTWSKKFESLAVPAPDWYAGTDPTFSTVIFMNHMNRAMYATSSSMVSRPAPKSGSGGGGSFGGGGGGGFSGGGFGGGGGGGW